MRLTEFTQQPVEEGVKDWLGRAALGAALTMTPAASAAPAPSPAQAEQVLMKTARASGLKGAELAAFMAQCAHETLDFTHLTEIGGSLDFRKYDPRFNQQKAKVLGNTEPGDGARFKGRGFIQLTGRDNYRRAGEALGMGSNLEEHPDLVEKDPSIAARVAIWFWKNRVQPDVTNFHDVHAVTKKINPGLHGLESRKSFFDEYKEKIEPLFGKKDQAPAKAAAKPAAKASEKPVEKPAGKKLASFDQLTQKGHPTLNLKTGEWTGLK